MKPFSIVSQQRFVRLFLMVLVQVGGIEHAGAASVTRVPYLQQGTTNSLIIRWRTDVATDGVVGYGLTPDNLSSTATSTEVSTEHIVLISGLQADTQYFYQIGTSTNWFPSDPSHFFTTAPPPGIPRPARIWVLGDAGTGSSEQVAVRDGYTSYAGSRHADLWLMLGDNAYDSGLDIEYQIALFDMYPSYLQNTMLWPTLGNHDSDSTSTNGVFPYFDIFTLPQNGEAGGLASGTENYYSFDFANIHFVCLDSAASDRTSNGPMCNWLRSDLAATTQDWLIAYWHHPPYTKGSHDSDAESNLIEVRQNMVPILESFGVDLVLCGHSHSYERSYLLDGHYDLSSTLTAAMMLNGGDGRIDGAGAYQKQAGISAHQGAIYTVAGSSGHTGGGSLNHPAMFVSLDMLGSVVIDIDNNRLDSVFVDPTGVVGDYFTILKAPPATNAPAAPSNLVATAMSGTQIRLGWSAASDNETGFKLEYSTNGVDFTQIAVLGAGVTNKLDEGLASGTLYYYRVRAFNSIGNSAYSDLAQATTLDVTNVLDTIPPAAVTDLLVTVVSSNSATLSWTAPGNDGNVGTAAFYDVRYSSNVITANNWGAAVQAVGTPIPASAGTLQSFTVEGLALATTYYFALKTSDEATNVSQLSNVPNGTTLTAPGTDAIPPAAVTNLTVMSVTANGGTLRWTAPGDDGNAGIASLYDVRYSTAIIAEANWATATQATGEPDPSIAGTLQTFNLTGLAGGTKYYFALKTIDKANNISPISNVPNGTTAALASPPAAPSSLRVTAVSSNEIDLVWRDNATNETGFKIERATDGANFLQIATTSATITNWADKSVVPGSLDFYRVRAYNSAGNSGYSNTNSAQAIAPGNSFITLLIPSNSVWKYLDNGSDQGTAWTALNFDDSSWKSGPAQLGYLGGHEATIVSYGPNSSAKYITTYFRQHFPITEPGALIGLLASVQRDDGAVVYLNGQEVFRSNMPTGAVNYLTPAPVSVSGTDKTSFHDSPPLDTSVLVAGDNVAAVELHQHSASSTSMDFNMQLLSTNRPAPPAISIAIGAGGQVQLRWAASIGKIYRVQYCGGVPSNAWTALGVDVIATNSTVMTTDPTGAVQQRFYRVLRMN